MRTNRGVPPTAAMSLRLTAIARHPTSSGPHRSQVKCTPSICASHVATTGPVNRSTAASSPTPSTTPGPPVGTRRRSRSISPNSPIDATVLSGERGIDLLPQPPGRGRHVLGHGDRGDHRNPAGPGPDDRGGVVRRDAADPHERQADRAPDLPQAGQADRGARVRLGAGGIDRADAEVVRPHALRGLAFVDRGRRHADEGARSHQGADVARRQVVLTDVHAVRTGDQRDIDAVVDDEGDPGRAAQRSNLARGIQHHPRRLVLHPQLHGGRPAPDRRLGDLAVGTSPGLVGVRDDVHPPVTPRHPARIRARSSIVARSSAATASINAARNVPGPEARSAAASAATSNQTSPATAAARGSGSTAQAAATAAVAMHPLPVIRARSGCPFAIRTVAVPSVTRSSTPVAAIAARVSLARRRARSGRPPTTPAASTARPAPGFPPRAAISPALPRTQAHRTSARIWCAWAVLNPVAPTPTGSRMTGMPRAFARWPALIIAATACVVSVPMLRTRAPAWGAISSTSSGACVITGAAPSASVTFATSPAVTKFVM